MNAQVNFQSEITVKTVMAAGFSVEPIEQNTPEWHQWRALGLGASSVPTVLGENPFQTPYKLWAEKVGLLQAEDLSNNPNVQRGVFFEEEANAAWEAKSGDFALPVCIVSNFASWMRVSLDGLCSTGEVLEIKCPSPKKMAFLRSKLTGNFVIGSHAELAALGFGHYYGQTQYQMVCAGAMVTKLWLYDTETKEGVELIVPFNEEYAERMIQEAAMFWDNIQTMTAPALDPERDVLTTDMLDSEDRNAWEQAEATYTDLEAKIKQLEAELKALKGEQDASKDTLTSIAGIWPKAESATGFKVTSFVRQGTVDYKAVLAEYAPEVTDDMLDKFRKDSSISVKITVPKASK